MALGAEVGRPPILTVECAAPYRAVGLRLAPRHRLYPPSNSPSSIVIKDAMVQLVMSVLPPTVACPIVTSPGVAPPVLEIAAGVAIFTL